MESVKLFDIIGKPVLTSRDSARRIEPELLKQARNNGSALRLDFSGACGVSPSFLDEALSVAEEGIANSGGDGAVIVFAKLPTALSSSHRAIARAHGRTLVVTEARDWEFRKG